MDDQTSIQEQVNPQVNFSSKIKIFLSQNKLFIILIAFLASISLGTTGYILTSKPKPKATSDFLPKENISQVSNPIVSPQKAPTSTPLPTPTPDLDLLNSKVATWSAYASDKYLYSIKYPPDWTAKITSQQDPKILEYVVLNPKNATKSGTLSITLSYGTRTYTEALALDSQIGESIFVASTSGTKKSTKNSDGIKSTSVILPFGKNSIILYAKDEYLTIFNQMLPTLKLSK